MPVNCEFLSVNTGSPYFGFEGTGVALRLGGKLVDAAGNPFMSRHHPEGDAAEIHHVVGAMAKEMLAGNGPPFYLDLSGDHSEFLRSALTSIGGFMPVNLGRLAAEGMSPFAGRQEWVPAVQTLRGGLRADIDGRTDIDGLFAAGLAQGFDPGLFNGWSTARAMWSGERVGQAAAGFATQRPAPVTAPEISAAAADRALRPLHRHNGPAPDDVLTRLQSALFPWDVSVLKNGTRLEEALGTVETLLGDVVEMRAHDPHELVKAHETAAMVRSGELFLRASLARTETRSSHMRSDHPDTDNDCWPPGSTRGAAPEGTRSWTLNERPSSGLRTQRPRGRSDDRQGGRGALRRLRDLHRDMPL